MSAYAKITGGAAVALSTIMAAIILAGGPGGGGTPTPTPTPTATPGAGTANVWVVPSGTCDSTPTRESSAVTASSAPAGAVACTVAQATGAANTGDTIGLTAGTHGPGDFSWGASGKTLTYVGDGAVTADGGTGDSNYNGFQLNANTTVRNIDYVADYPIVGLYESNITWEDSRLYEGRQVRTCASDEPILLEDGAATSYTIQNVTLRNVVVDGQRAVSTGCSGGDGLHLEQLRIGRGVSGVLLERVTFKECKNGSGYNGCGSGHVFITTTANSLWEPAGIVIRNSLFYGTPNYAIQVNANATPCTNWTLAYNTSSSEILGLNGCSATNSVLLVGNAAPRPQNCTTGFTYTRNVWEWGTGTPCGTDSRTADMDIDADLRPAVGSALIGGGETPGPSDYCTGALGSVDVEGTTRPVGAACDAGAIEAG